MEFALTLAQSTASEGTVRAVGISMATVSALLVVLAFLAARFPTRLRVRRDLIRLGLQSAGTLWVAAASGVGVPVQMVAVAGLIGVWSGWVQGKNVDVSHRGEQIYIRRSSTGLVLWGGGLLLMQLASFVNQFEFVNLGQAFAWFSAGLTAGMMSGRLRPVADAKRTLAGATAGMAAVVTLAIAVPPPALADHLDPVDLLEFQIDCGAVLSELGVAHEVRTFDAEDGRVFITCLPGGQEPIIQVYEQPSVDQAIEMVAGLQSGHGDIQHPEPAVGGEQVAFFEFTGDAAGCQIVARVGARVFGFVANDVDCLGDFLDQVAAVMALVPIPDEEAPDGEGADPEAPSEEQPVEEVVEPEEELTDEEADGEGPVASDNPAEETTDAVDSTTEPVAVLVEDNDPEDVTADEATAAAFTALVILLGNGAISLIEFMELQQLSRRDPASFGKAVGRLIVHGGDVPEVDLPENTLERFRPESVDKPPTDPVVPFLESLQEVDDIEAPGPVDMPPVQPRGEFDPWHYPPQDEYTGEDRPVPGSRVYDVDRDGEPDIIMIDEDADGLTDVVHTPGDEAPPDTLEPVGDVEEVIHGDSEELLEHAVDGGAGDVVLDDVAEAEPEAAVEPENDDAEPETSEAPTPNGVAVSKQEIDDIVDWGSRHGRSHEDIRKDIQGLNQARGGTEPVPIGELPEQVMTPRGRVVASIEEVEAYRYEQELVTFYEMQKAAVRAASRSLQDEIAVWRDIELLVEHRAATGISELLSMADEWEREAAAASEAAESAAREGTSRDFLKAYEERSEIDRRFRERIRSMTETTESASAPHPLGDDLGPQYTAMGFGDEGAPDVSDPDVDPDDDLSHASAFNRASQRLAQLAEKQEGLLEDYAEFDQAADAAREAIDAFESRAEGP